MKLRSSRRAAGLKPTDFDHEISLVDNDGTLSPHDGHHYAQMDRTATNANLLTPSQSTRRSSRAQLGGDESDISSRHASRSGSRVVIVEHPEEQQSQGALRPSVSQPSIEVHGTEHGPSASRS